MVSGLRTQGWGTAHLGPGSSPPPARAQLAVAGPAALGSSVIAVLGVHGAGGVVVQRLNTAHGANLHACPPTAPAARLPLARDPPARAHSTRSAPGETPVDRGRAACSSRRIFPVSGRCPGGLLYPCLRTMNPKRAHCRETLVWGWPLSFLSLLTLPSDLTNPSGQQHGCPQHLSSKGPHLPIYPPSSLLGALQKEPGPRNAAPSNSGSGGSRLQPLG